MPQTLKQAQAKVARLRAELSRAQSDLRTFLRSIPAVKDGRQYRGDRRMRSIILHFETLGDMLPSDLAHNLGLSRTTVHKHLRALVTQGVLVAKGYGLYGLSPDHVPASKSESLAEYNRHVFGSGNEYPKNPEKLLRPKKKIRKGDT